MKRRIGDRPVDRYSKWIGVSVIVTTLISNYAVLHYRVNELTENVSDTQNILSDMVIDVAVIKSKLENK